jgi:hypothetical protein
MRKLMDSGVGLAPHPAVEKAIRITRAICSTTYFSLNTEIFTE